MQQIANLPTADTYTGGLVIEQANATTLAYIVANASVVAQFRGARREGGGEDSYGPEVLLDPERNTIVGVSGAKFRSAVAGTPARIVARLYAADEPQIGTGIPFTGTLEASGAVTPVTLTGGGVTELAYAEFGADVTINATTEAGANQIVAAPAITADGIAVTVVEFSTLHAKNPGANTPMYVVLFDNGNVDFYLAEAQYAAAGGNQEGGPMLLRRRYVPAAGSHAFSVRAYVGSGAGVIRALGYLRITQNG